MVLDVKGAYLKSSIREELSELLFLRLPDKRIVRLKKYIYGLKQAGYEWARNVTACLIRHGYTQSTADPCCFSRLSGMEHICMCLHVDDFFVIATHESLLTRLHAELTAEYGSVSIDKSHMLAYLGMSVLKDPHTGTVTLHQPGYIEKMLTLFLDGYTTPDFTLRRTYTPMKATPTTHPDNTPVDTQHYLAIIGTMNYLAQYTRPDLLYAMSILAQRCSAPTANDLIECQRVLRYIACTKLMGLRFSPGPLEVTCYVDAAHNSTTDGRGHYGYTFALGRKDGIFFAVSKKLKLVTPSSTESEYVALCEATREAIWLRRLLHDIGFPIGPILIWQDNKSTILMVQGHRNHKACKHISPKFHFTGEAVEANYIKIEHMPTELMIADVLTKPLAGRLHAWMASRLLNISTT